MDPVQVFGFEPDITRLIFRKSSLGLVDLLACRCVCRQWRDFLDETKFIEELTQGHLVDCWEQGRLEHVDMGKFCYLRSNSLEQVEYLNYDTTINKPAPYQSNTILKYIGILQTSKCLVPNLCWAQSMLIPDPWTLFWKEMSLVPAGLAANWSVPSIVSTGISNC